MRVVVTTRQATTDSEAAQEPVLKVIVPRPEASGARAWRTEPRELSRREVTGEIQHLVLFVSVGVESLTPTSAAGAPRLNFILFDIKMEALFFSAIGSQTSRAHPTHLARASHARAASRLRDCHGWRYES